MARIENTERYVLNETPTIDDYVIGTDLSDSKRTKNYAIKDILALGGGPSPGVTGRYLVNMSTGPSIARVVVFSDGELLGEYADQDIFEVDLSKSLVFVVTNDSGAFGGTANIVLSAGPSISLFVGTLNYINEGTYNSFLDVEVNNYATLNLPFAS